MEIEYTPSFENTADTNLVTSISDIEKVKYPNNLNRATNKTKVNDLVWPIN